MPITFDTLDELKAFYRSFRLDGVAATAVKEKPVKGPKVSRKSDEEPPRKRGRKPGSTAAAVKPAAKRGPKPKAVKEVTLRKAAAPKGDTLTSKIRETIRKFLDAGRSFTANEVYDDLVQRDPSVNKQSVITSVLKQMNSTFKEIAVTERPGNGPRPVKLYNP